jgi:hypothetical protein
VVLAEPPAGMFGSFFGGSSAILREPGREEEVIASGIAHTIVRFGKLLDQPGGTTYIEFTQVEGMVPGPLSTEDAALVAARAIAFPPSQGEGTAFTVGSTGPGLPPAQEQWAEMFGQLKPSVTASVAR